MNDEQQIIVLRENAKTQLAQIKNIDEGKDYLDRVKALEAYARATKQDAEILLMVQEQKIRSMRILGQLLQETDFDNKGGDRGKNQYGGYEARFTNETVPKPRLADLGITKNESHTYQTIATIPELEFEKQIEEVKSDFSPVKELTVSRFKNIGSDFKRQEKIDDAAKAEWPKDELEMKEQIESGHTVAINMNKHFHLLKWAQEEGLYERIDRFTDWGNPFELGKDGERDEVCNAYAEFYFPLKRSLHKRIKTLSGKVLGCHCHPKQCHGDFLADLADGRIKLADLKNYNVNLKSNS